MIPCCFKNIGEGFRHLHERFGRGLIFGCFDGAINRFQPAIEQCQEKRLLAFKMMIERALADSRFTTDIIHAGGVEAAVGKQLNR